MEEFKLPEKWFVCPKTEENLLKIKQYFNKFENYKISHMDNSYASNGEYYTNKEMFLKKNYTEITFEQFKKYVLKEQIAKCPFKVGDVVELSTDKDFAAKNGDIAKVISIDEYPTYIRIMWLTKTIQADGDYYPTDFKLHEKDWTKATKEELLEEAKRRYPVGTKFYSSYNNKYKDSVKTAYYGWFNSNNIVVNYVNGSSIYTDGKWAEIISLPQFEEGKWYKSLPEENNRNGAIYYGKYLKGDFIASEYRVSGEIREGSYEFNSGYIWKEATLEEIQQYLPDGHPDKMQKKIYTTKDLRTNSNLIIYLDNQKDWQKIKDLDKNKLNSEYRGAHCYSFLNRSFSSSSSKNSTGAYSKDSIIITIDQIQFEESSKQLLSSSYGTMKRELTENDLDKYFSFMYGGRIYLKSKLIKERSGYYLINNDHSNNDGHKDKSKFKYSLFFMNLEIANKHCSNIKELSEEEEYQNVMNVEIGDTVKCISENKSKFNTGNIAAGAGWLADLEFVVTNIGTFRDYNVYFGGNNTNGVYSDAVRLVKKKKDNASNFKIDTKGFYPEDIIIVTIDGGNDTQHRDWKKTLHKGDLAQISYFSESIGCKNETVVVTTDGGVLYNTCKYFRLATEEEIEASGKSFYGRKENCKVSIEKNSKEKEPLLLDSTEEDISLIPIVKQRMVKLFNIN